MRGQVTIVPPQDVTKRCQAAPQRQPRVLAAPRVNHAGFGARTRGDKLHNSLRKTTVTSHNFIRDPYELKVTNVTTQETEGGAKMTSKNRRPNN